MVSYNLRLVRTNVAAAPAFDALGDPTRRAIFELLAVAPRPVGALADALPVTRPAVSQHLKVLKNAGLVRDRPEGTRRIYEVDGDGLRALQEYLEMFWQRSLGRFKAAAERERSRR
jgi:DNA-binding transcriptional ArsR family regulator